MTDWPDKFSACLLGTAVGDALGLPCEGLSPRRAQRLFGGAPLSHHLLFHRGMISDDTEHACMTAQALLACRGNPDAFARSLAWRLRGWLLAVPAGVGFATLRSILKLWLGFGPDRSGVHSAGNGPAMRAPILGLWTVARGMTRECRDQLLRPSTRTTHTDERAIEGAQLIAHTTARVASTTLPIEQGAFIEDLLQQVRGEELRQNLKHMQACLKCGASTQEFTAMLGLQRGVTGYINHTVPVALYCHLRWPGDFRQAVEDAILAGGDTDTTAAIVGGMTGAALGTSAVPPEWLTGILEWPRSIAWIRSLAERLAQNAADPQLAAGPLPLFWPGLLVRNPAFAAIVLTHGFRRLLPPY